MWGEKSRNSVLGPSVRCLQGFQGEMWSRQRIEGSEWGRGGEAVGGETHVDVISKHVVFHASAYTKLQEE